MPKNYVKKFLFVIKNVFKKIFSCMYQEEYANILHHYLLRTKKD